MDDIHILQQLCMDDYYSYFTDRGVDLKDIKIDLITLIQIRYQELVTQG